ncbi:MAG: protein translocase subunit SecD [Propionibacteriaceae bacterium]|nr:protein translocase subunit SecD [Propionibacteriaceae bacterium]
MPTPTTRRRRPGMTLLGLFVIVAIMAALMVFSRSWTPRLGLDLSGGTTITLTAISSGTGGVDPANLEQARNIIEQRVNSLGVGEVSVTTSGSNQIIVSAPNVQGDALIEMVGQTAQLEFRRVYNVDQSTAYIEGKATELPSVPTIIQPNDTIDPADVPELPTDTKERQALLAELLAWTPSEEDNKIFYEFQCGDPMSAEWNQPLIACPRNEGTETTSLKYLLGPMILEGNLVKNASAGLPEGQMKWIVTLEFDGQGATLFSDATTELANATEPTDQFAIVLDGRVISAPSVNEPIPGGNAQISGTFNQDSANNLANVLKYGALPLTFDSSDAETISPTLGADQLIAGLIAGGIGLLLVIGFCLLYYRGLTVLVVASLMMAGGVVYMLICLLGQSVGFALSLPGLAGVIVAIGITADSFVIYFERIRDDAREGRSIRTAVETGWERARRTIVVADGVTILSAVVLFILSIGAIKGFAFTLGLTTLVDLALIFFFTKPLMSLLVKTKFYGQGMKGSGFEATHLGIEPARRRRATKDRTAKEAANV